MKERNIFSRNNQKVKDLLESEKKQRVMIFEGNKLVVDILERRIPVDLLIIDEGHLPDCPAVIEKHRHRITECWKVSPSVMGKISRLKTPPPLMAVIPVRSKPRRALDGYQSIFVLEGIQDPSNCGAVFRSAAAFAIDCVVLTGSSVTPCNRKFLRAAQDSVFLVDSIHFPKTLDFIEQIDPGRFFIYTTSSHGGGETVPVTRLQLPCVVVFGSEGSGLKPEILRKYSVLQIPHESRIESLNLAVSVSIVAFEIYQRKKEIDSRNR